MEKIPEPEGELSEGEQEGTRALIFDFEYSNHKGVVVYVRVLDGELKKGDTLIFSQTKEKFSALEVGIFHPNQVPQNALEQGTIGYVVTGIKRPGVASVGDTITSQKNPLPPLEGYLEPRPVVWASVYPESQDDFSVLTQSLMKLKLSDPSISFEEEASGALGRGYRCGFLGMLHLEIIMERLKREFNMELIMTTPSITYEIENMDGKREKIYSPSRFPDHGTVKRIFEPWINAKIITPPDYVGGVMQLLYEHEAEVGNSEIFGDKRTSIAFTMPLRELMRNFFDELKSVSSGFASLSYEIGDMKEADVARLDILVAEEVVPAFSRVVSRKRAEEDAKATVDRLYQVLPKQLFVMKIQGRALGRIISSKTVSALKKDVTAKLYGGDITRKMKLREKQKKGKKKMKERGKVRIPHEVFLKMVRRDEN